MTRFDQPADVPDTTAILNSIGEAAYEWQLDTDALIWSENAVAVLGIASLAEVASGRAFAQKVEADAGQSRAEAVAAAQSSPSEVGTLYQLQYALKRADGTQVWLEDTGRCFTAPGGKLHRAQGIVRIIDERHAREHQLIRLAKFDALTGEMNRASLTETLAATLEDTVRFRGSCGFLLIAVDHLGQLNEAYGFDVGDEIIAKVARRIRARLRGKDHLGRISGNKFGAVLTQCTTDELGTAAERLLAGVRDETIPTAAGPVAVTITIGGVNAPRHARSMSEILSRAQDALHTARAKRHGSFQAYQPNLERDALRRDSVRATDEIVAALNERRITLAY